MSDDLTARIVEAAADAARREHHLCFTGDLAPLSKCATASTWRPCLCERQARAALAAAVREAGVLDDLPEIEAQDFYCYAPDTLAFLRALAEIADA